MVLLMQHPFSDFFKFSCKSCNNIQTRKMDKVAGLQSEKINKRYRYLTSAFCRPDIQKLLSLAGKTVNCIIVKDFSRFGRNLIEVGDYLDQIFPALGVRFIAVNEGYDSIKACGSSVGLEVSLKAMIYEMYSRDISEKVRSVQRAKMQKGEYLCGIAFYGYKRSETVKNHLEIDSAAAEVVQKIFCMAVDGIKPAQIAINLNQERIPSPLMYRKANHTDAMRRWKTSGDITYWTRDNVRRILCDERYTGCLAGCKRTVADLPTKRTQLVPKEKWIITENTQDAIVSKEMFVRAQAVLRHVKQKNLQKKSCQKFHGLIKCAFCGRALSRMACRQTYYICPTAKAAPCSICKYVCLEEAMIERILLIIIQMQRKLYSIPNTRKKKRDFLQNNIKSCQSAMKRLKTLQEIAFEQYAEGQINKQEYLLRKQELVEKQKKLERQLTEWKEGFEELQKEQKKTEKESGYFIEELTRDLLTKVIKAIYVKENGDLEIMWNIADYNATTIPL